ncbi:MAG: hypothetical protein COV44_06830 [Deltaproteobacteria bacterium CG11_big_fil_rev_8_21_14_0_20_45_16]|nr:MAG: hypothetical protein COV44_06830 [Deltaproteobacteria bacterium CG11_big_fil_rev_8_21_14_0_20_45_16]
MNPQFLQQLIFILGLAVAGILYAVSVFAIGSPHEFSKWFFPFQTIKKLMGWKAKAWERGFAYLTGGFCLTFLFFLQFVLGGVFVTGFFELWHSPFAVFFQPGGF